MRSAVRLAAMTPANSAVPMTFPLGTLLSFSKSSVSNWHVTVPVADALRAVTGLSPTSTIRARPCLSICDRSVIRSLPVSEIIGGLAAANCVPVEACRHCLRAYWRNSASWHERLPRQLRICAAASSAAPILVTNGSMGDPSMRRALAIIASPAIPRRNGTFLPSQSA